MIRFQHEMLMLPLIGILLILLFFSCKKDIFQKQNTASPSNKVETDQFTATTSGVSYYVDPSSTASIQNGSISAPWKTLAQASDNMWRFAPGDHIYFKKGQSYKGSLIVIASGTATAPITFTTYGTGNPPIFEYDLNTSTPLADRNIIDVANVQHVVLDGFILTDKGLNPTDHNILARASTGIEIGNSSYITITNMDISLLGIGISISGNNNTITRCAIRNMRMIIKDASPNNDFGAIGIEISGSNNIISYNTFRDNWATSIDYKYDGGAVEFFGPGNNNKILYNTCINNSGFTEFGSRTGGAATNNQIAYNLLINNGQLFWFNLQGTSYPLSVSNLQFYNNTIVETVKQRLNSNYLIAASAPVANNMLNMKNNLFYINTAVKMTLNISASSFVHTNNLYRFINSGSLDYSLSTTELNVANTIALFQNTSSTDPANWNYNLATGCPAVDHGVNLGFTSDLKGNAVYSGAAPDIGALESGSTSSSGSGTSGGITFTAPGRIQAENYSAMSGITVSYTTDGGDGKFVGWIDDGDWMDYKINLPSTRTYKVNFRVSSPNNNAGPLQLRNSNGTILSTVSTPNTGSWNTYTTVSTDLTLPAGQQTLRIYAARGGWNINWFEIQ